MQHSELRRIYDQLDEMGYTWRRSGRGHYKIYSPQGRFVTTGPSKNGERHTVLNFRSQLRRAGVSV